MDLEQYQRDHKFSREKFIEQIKMMHEVSVELEEKPRLKLAKINEFTDEQLVKAHRFYWDKL